jgi:LacI family transcriptional regulator
MTSPAPKPGSGRVTIRDVARLAGVSPATVSKVLNDVPYVSSKARQSVLSAVGKLDFKPNSIARSLKTKRTLTLGLVTDDLKGVFTLAMMHGVEEAASAQGFSVFLCNSYGEAAREQAHLEVLLNKQVDGVILLSGYRVRERGAPALALGRLPTVYLYQYTHDVLVPCVVPDDFGGAELGTRHLIGLGRRRVALINGPYHYEATHLRLEGYKQALKEAGLPFDPALVRAGKWHESSGYRLAHELLALPEPPDAIFCSSDSLAVGALDALHQLGLEVPREVALVGFDNREFAAHQRPPLSSVALPLNEMGKLAGEVLLAAILAGLGGPPKAALHKVPCYLVERQSCGASSSRT